MRRSIIQLVGSQTSPTPGSVAPASLLLPSGLVQPLPAAYPLPADEPDYEVDDDPSQAMRLDVGGMPICVTVSLVSAFLLLCCCAHLLLCTCCCAHPAVHILLCCCAAVHTTTTALGVLHGVVAGRHSLPVAAASAPEAPPIANLCHPVPALRSPLCRWAATAW